MIRQGYELGCAHEFWRGPESVSFWLMRYAGASGERQFAASIEWQPVQAASVVDPTFDLLRDRAQALMDMLWGAGLRPTQGRQSEGALAATDAHLQDMRAIAFAKLEIQVQPPIEVS